MADNPAVPGPATPLPVKRSGRDLYSSYLQVKCRSLRSGVDVCTPIGEIDMATEPLLQCALDEFERHATPLVIVDLSGVAFLSVGGARQLHAAVKRTHAQTRRMKLVSASHPVARALEVTGYGDDVRTYPTVYEALGAEEAPPTLPVATPQEVATS